MIYSTDYAELYRRVMQGDEVLCFDGDYPYFVFLTHGGRLWLTNRDAKAIDMGTSLELFTGRCLLLTLRYVPDNEGLVFAANELVDSIDRFENKHPYHFPNHTLGKYDELKTQLKPYDQ